MYTHTISIDKHILYNAMKNIYTLTKSFFLNGQHKMGLRSCATKATYFHFYLKSQCVHRVEIESKQEMFQLLHKKTCLESRDIRNSNVNRLMRYDKAF